MNIGMLAINGTKNNTSNIWLMYKGEDLNKRAASTI